MKITLTKPVKGRYFRFITLLPGSVLELADKDGQKMIDQGKAEAQDAKKPAEATPKKKE